MKNDKPKRVFSGFHKIPSLTSTLVKNYCYKVKKVHRKSLYKAAVLKIVANNSSINALIPSLSKKSIYLVY